PPAMSVMHRSVSFNDVFAVDDYDLWAGGFLEGSNPDTTLFHWNGDTWTEHPEFSGIGAVEALWGFSGHDIWAVGGFEGGPALHFDGQAWTSVPVTGPGLSQSLAAIWGACPNDLWTVGFADFTQSANDFRPTVFHWDGAAWTGVDAPSN